MFRNFNFRLLIISFLGIALMLGILSTQVSPTQIMPTHIVSTQPTQTSSTQISPTSSTPWLSISGRDIKDPDGKTVILRGVSLVDISVANSRTRNASLLIDMATDNANGWYARVIRLPVYPNAIDGQPGWIADPDGYFTKHLDPAVQHCISRQVYCIIDWHYIKDYNSQGVDTATRAFWNYVAPKYADSPNVIFELYNEPIYPDDWRTWKKTAQPWVDIMRASAPKNLILVGGPRWSQNVSEAAADPFSGGNLVYAAHIYPEHGGANIWDSWFGDSSKTVPYFITEWGWQQGGSLPTSGTKSGFGVPFSAYLDSKGVSWTAWVFDDFWQPMMFDRSWNLLGGENYMGQFTKDLLFQHRNIDQPDGGSDLSAVNTPVDQIAILTPTPNEPINTPVSTGDLRVQLITGGTDNQQQSTFHYLIRNNGSGAQSKISVRIYFTIDASQPAASYVLEKYYDQSGAANVTGPTLASGFTYYFTVNYGTAVLAAGTDWEYHTALRLNDWANNFSGTNDWWHTNDALPATYIDWNNLPAYINDSRAWGREPAALQGQ
ncbi:MAG: cellulase family glycosylhydrolase [Anaerolineales bacterium]|nr:cellulase family glycosylhydrolase [Anaerolineales bacterium]